KCAGRERRIGSDHLQEPPAAERRNGVVRTEVGMLPTRGRANLGAFRQRGNRDVEIRSAPEQMIAGGRQGPIYTQRRARRQRDMATARPDVARARALPYTCPLVPFTGLAVHTPLTGAAVFGGVGMGPQEHAFRSGVDVIVATPGRLLDHFRQPYAKLEHLEVLVLDEADRMLDMGFLPDIRRVLRHL